MRSSHVSIPPPGLYIFLMNEQKAVLRREIREQLDHDISDRCVTWLVTEAGCHTISDIAKMRISPRDKLFEEMKKFGNPIEIDKIVRYVKGTQTLRHKVVDNVRECARCIHFCKSQGVDIPSIVLPSREEKKSED